MEHQNLFGEHDDWSNAGSRERAFNDYEAFTEKFKPKKTTDDCYTPPLVYDAVKNWVSENILNLDGVEIVRPFYPGGDYVHQDYPEGSLVLDNPPFSILAQIRRFYHAKGIRYFLFAPALTLANSARELDAVYLTCGADIVYENGANVPTSFITNLPCGDTRIWCAGSLTQAVERACKENRRAMAKEAPPKYIYPMTVLSPALLQKIAKAGIDFRVSKSESVAINALDSQRPQKKALFGGGWLISERAAAERAAAERAAAERAAAERAAAKETETIAWPLSNREKEILARMSAPVLF